MALFNIFSKKKKDTLDKGLEKTKDNIFSKLTRAVAGKSQVDESVLDELEEGARGYKTYDEWFLHIKEYTKELKHQVNIRNEITNAIELETMHSSKGLEYNNVIILGANEGITPHKKAVLDGDIEEERRLFYVAMTRAKKRLYITYTSERYGKKTKQSRFIKDILGEENIDEHKNK